MQELVKLQVRHHLIIQIENQFQLIFHALRHAEIHCSIDGEADLIRHQGQETNFFFVVCVWVGSAER